MLYGQHAAGLTTSVLRKLDAADSRALRVMSKSPSFLARESTVALRARLQIPSPTQALRKILEGRVQKCAVEDSRDFFQAQLDSLQEPDSHIATPGLLPCSVSAGVPCTACGVYFPDRRTMHSHFARKHPEDEVSHTPLTAEQYASSTVDGVPECAKCGKRFTRVESTLEGIAGQGPRDCPC